MKNLVAILIFSAVASATSHSEAIAPGKAVGSATAPIRIEVFSDFQCPACKSLAEETIRPLKAEHVAKGKVYLIHRDFPLTSHAHARQAATLANAAARINKYEQVSAEIYRQQSVWAASGKVEAAVAGVLTPDEMKKVRALLTDKKIAADIDQDVALGNKKNVRSTPTMLVTHKGREYPVSGPVTFGVLRKFLDDLLSK